MKQLFKQEDKMKLKLLILTILFTVGLFGQSDRLTVGELTTGDSIVTFYSAGKEWVEIFLVDSASTNDSCVVEIQNPINMNYTTLGVKDQSEETFVNVLVPTADVNGKLYIIWMMYPRNIRLRKTDVHSLAENIDYAIQTKGISE
jgi:hypothetical protein